MMERLSGLWGAHRTFLVTVAAGVLALSTGLAAVSSIEGDAARHARRSRVRTRDIDALGASLVGREGLAAGIAAALTETVGPAVRGSLEMRGRQGFVLREGETEGIVHFQALQRVKAAAEAAVKAGTAFPKRLGFDEKPAAARTQEQLALLDASERVIGATRSLGLQTVAAFAPGTPQYEPVGAAASASAPDRRARSAPDGEAKAREARLFLRRLPLRIDVTGSLDGVERLVSWFQRPGAFFEITDLALERARGDAVRLRVTVWALALLREGEMPKGALSPRRGGRSGSGGLRRRRSRRARR